MRNILIIGLLLLGLSSCDDFLEYKDKDKIIPKELSHFDEFVYGEIINKTEGSLMNYLSYMTDETMSYVSSSMWLSKEDLRDEMFSYFTWAKEPQVRKDEVEVNDKAWSFFYHRILMCNITFEQVKELDEDIEGVKNRLLGESLFMRALSYFYLVNLYGEPYESAAQAKTALGVPINENVGVEANVYNRATLDVNYTLMEEDLKAAITYFEKGQKKGGIYRPNKDAALLLLSRVYLYQKKYDDVITVVDDLLKTTETEIIPYSTLEKFISSDDVVYKVYNTNNPGMIFSWGKLDVDATGFGYDLMRHSKAFFCASSELIGLYDEGNDLRFSRYYDKYDFNNYDEGIFYVATKNYCKASTANEAYDQALRLEEAYLNRAEAYIEKGEHELSMDDVNAIRAERIKGEYELVANSVDEAREFYRLEKRLEFSFEGLRWFDIRRWGLEIEHLYQDYSTPTVINHYVLKAGSPNYVLSLPLEIQRSDDKIERFERVETKQ